MSDPNQVPPQDSAANSSPYTDVHTPPPYGAEAPYGAPQYSAPPPQSAGLSRNAAAGISYLTFIPAVIFLVIEPYKRDPFVRFNAWQEIALTLTGFAINLVAHFLGVVGSILAALLGLVLFVFWIIAIVKAFNGTTYKIPVVGDLAVSLAGQ